MLKHKHTAEGGGNPISPSSLLRESGMGFMSLSIEVVRIRQHLVSIHLPRVALLKHFGSVTHFWLVPVRPFCWQLLVSKARWWELAGITGC